MIRTPALPRILSAFVILLALSGCDDHKKSSQQANDASTSAVAFIKQNGTWGHDAKSKVDEKSLLLENYYFVFDGSGSMADTGCSGGTTEGRIEPAKRAAIRFAQGLPASANLGLFVFDNNGVGERVALGRGTANRAAFAQAVRAIVAGDGTPLGASLNTALQTLHDEANRQHGYGGYHIVVTTDGQATDASTMGQAVDQIVQTPVVLETIGFCIEEGHPLNVPGRTVYHNAMNPEDLNKGLDAILAESDSFAADTAFPAKATP